MIDARVQANFIHKDKPFPAYLRIQFPHSFTYVGSGNKVFIEFQAIPGYVQVHCWRQHGNNDVSLLYKVFPGLDIVDIHRDNP